MREIDTYLCLDAPPETMTTDAQKAYSSTQFVIRSGHNPRWQDDFSRLMQSEILPVLARLLGDASPPPEQVGEAPNLDPEALLRALLEPGPHSAQGIIAALETEGVAREHMLLDLLAPAARALGGMWETDDCDFVQVSIGLQRLQALMRDLEPPARPLSSSSVRRRILLLPAPGETHTFGVEMAAHLFRSRGWDAVQIASTEYEQRIATEHFDAIGFSLSCQVCLDKLPAAIEQARQLSRNRAIRILVGGGLFDRHPELAAKVGADAVASAIEKTCEMRIT